MHELTNKNVANTQWAHLHIYAEKKTQMNGGQAIQNKFRFYKTKNKCDMTKQQQNKDKRKQRNKQKSLWFWQILTKLSLLVIQPIKFSLCLYITHSYIRLYYSTDFLVGVHKHISAERHALC